MTSPSDPRLGFTSASNAEADLLCPGRHIAQRGLEGYETRESRSGDVVHAAFAGQFDMESLNPLQRRTVARGREIEEHVAECWFASIGHPLEPEEIAKQISTRAHRELRLWAYHRGQKIHSGGVDALWLGGDMRYALIEDLKSLFGDIDDASTNLQLRDYAALVYLNYGCESVSVFINQPNVRWKFEEQKLVVYGILELEEAASDMQKRVLASQDLGAPRYPGKKQCNFCLAAGTERCPESLREIRDFQNGFEQTWPWWSPAERGHFIATCKMVKQLADSSLEIAKESIKGKPDWAEGWQVTKDVSVRNIDGVSAGQIFDILLDAYGTRAEAIRKLVDEHSGFSVADLEFIHREFSEFKGDADCLKAEFDVLFGHLVKTSTRSGSLRAAKSP